MIVDSHYHITIYMGMFGWSIALLFGRYLKQYPILITEINILILIPYQVFGSPFRPGFRKVANCELS